jgi:hypothetical protein
MFEADDFARTDGGVPSECPVGSPIFDIAAKFRTADIPPHPPRFYIKEIRVKRNDNDRYGGKNKLLLDKETIRELQPIELARGDGARAEPPIFTEAQRC